MKCSVCGRECGETKVCTTCAERMLRGEIVRCPACGQFHDKNEKCMTAAQQLPQTPFLYEAKSRLISLAEQPYYAALCALVPQGYHVFPQINLAAIINRTDVHKYQNELYRNIDFLITDNQFAPKIAVEINDSSHQRPERQQRDYKVNAILEEAGIPLLPLWTSYGVNRNYMQRKITEALSAPASRVHHPELQAQSNTKQQAVTTTNDVERDSKQKKKKQGCYIATCVYGAYDCPPVWVLRRYRDLELRQSCFGRILIKLYYRISPGLVRLFSGSSWFKAIWRPILDRKVEKLRRMGYSDQPYMDIQ